MTVWTIREATVGDADALAACIDAAYASYTARIDDLPPVSADCAQQIIDHQVWVAEIADVIAGGLVLSPRDGFLLLVNIAVHPDHKGAGLGRALMEHAEEQARAQGYLELRLSTHAKIPENVSLYEHLGWEETERSGNRVSMRKAL